MKKDLHLIMLVLIISCFLIFDFGYLVNSKEGETFEYTSQTDDLILDFKENAPINEEFGEANIFESGVAFRKNRLISKDSLPFSNETKTFDDLVYVVYKFDNTINTVVNNLGGYNDDLYRFNNQTIAIDNNDITDGYVYEKESINNLYKYQNFYPELMVEDVNYADVELDGYTSIYLDVCNKVSEEVSKLSIANHKDYNQDAEFTIPEDGYYQVSTRASFNIYLTQVYEIVYEVKNITKESFFNNTQISYSIKGYELKSETVKLSYLENSDETGVYKVKMVSEDPLLYVYDDIKQNKVIYY